jgi:hypothetical protein
MRLRNARVFPVDVRVQGKWEAVDARDVRVRALLVARLDDSDRDVRELREPVGNHKSARAASDDDKVKLQCVGRPRRACYMFGPGPHSKHRDRRLPQTGERHAEDANKSDSEREKV